MILRYYRCVDLAFVLLRMTADGHRGDRQRRIMSNPRKCANLTCTCLAPEKKKYCSDHCEGLGNRMEIICLCSHEECGATVLQPSAMGESSSRTEAGGQATRF
jgi:hypothetical protein